MVAIIVTFAAIAAYIYQTPQQATQKNYIIGVVNPNLGSIEINRGFIAGLREYGYIEGENTTFLKYTGKFDMDKAIKSMLEQNADLIFCATTPATRKIKEATKDKDVPVVFAMFDPIKSGVINNLVHPENKLTGVQLSGSTPKALEWLLILDPTIKHIFVPIKYDTAAAKQSIASFKTAADHFGIKLVIAEVNSIPELDDALAGMPQNIDAILLTHSLLISSHTSLIVDAAIKRKLITIASIGQAKAGALMAYAIRNSETGRQASRLAHLALQGVKVNDIPAEKALFFLEINQKTADAIGLRIPNDILLQADFIYR